MVLSTMGGIKEGSPSNGAAFSDKVWISGLLTLRQGHGEGATCRRNGYGRG